MDAAVCCCCSRSSNGGGRNITLASRLEKNRKTFSIQNNKGKKKTWRNNLLFFRSLSCLTAPPNLTHIYSMKARLPSLNWAIWWSLEKRPRKTHIYSSFLFPITTRLQFIVQHCIKNIFKMHKLFLHYSEFNLITFPFIRQLLTNEI